MDTFDLSRRQYASIPADTRVSRPGDAAEHAARTLASRAREGAAELPPITKDRDGHPLPTPARTYFDSQFGYDFSRVKVHTDDTARARADALDAAGFVEGEHISLHPALYRPGTREAHHLIGHELAHVALTGDRPTTLYRLTKGEQVVENAKASWLDTDATVKLDVDVIRTALRDLQAGKSVRYNASAGARRINSALSALGKTNQESTVRAQWTSLVNNRKNAGTAAYKADQLAFLHVFQTPLARLGISHPESQAKYWLKNTPTQVLDAIFAAATPEMPADQLYAYASKEGLVDYVRDQAMVPQGADPTSAQLKGVITTTPISGYDYLGTDDFFGESKTKDHPLATFLPKGYNTSTLGHEKHTNEEGRDLEAPTFPNLTSGLQALAAMMRRRRALFLDDVNSHGYAKPTTDELIYWTYVYFNSGPNTGQLKKYMGKRKLGDWIAKGEYPNAIKLLESWRMIREMRIF